MGKTSYSSGVRWWHIAIGIAVGVGWLIFRVLVPLIASAAGQAMASGPSADPLFSVSLTNNVTLHVADILTKRNLEFIDISAKRVFFEHIPDFVRNKLPDRLRPPSAYAKRCELEYGEIYPVLKLEFPKKWLKLYSINEIEKRLLKAVNSAGIQKLRARFIDDQHSWAQDLVLEMDPVRLHSQHFAVLETQPFETVSNQTVIELDFLATTSTGTDVISQTYRLANPASVSSSELQSPSRLPETKTINGVSVTLKKLLAKTVHFNSTRRSYGGRAPWKMFESAEYLKAAGTSADQYHTTVVFEISEPDTSVSLLTIRDVKVSYSGALIPYNSGGWDKVVSDNTEIITINNDLGALRQAVSLDVQLENPDGTAWSRGASSTFQFVAEPKPAKTMAMPLTK